MENRNREYRMNNCLTEWLGSLFCLVDKLVWMKKIFLFSSFLFLGCQQAKNEQFNFEEREINPSIRGLWQIFEYVDNSFVFLEMNNESKMIENMISFNKQQFGDFSESDSLRVLSVVDLLRDNIDDYYLDFYTSEKVKAGVVLVLGDSLIKYELDGYYELDMDKLRIEMPYHDYPIKVDGSYHWYVFKNQLRLYPNFLNDSSTYSTYYLKNEI